jgi:hypothetical protein
LSAVHKNPAKIAIPDSENRRFCDIFYLNMESFRLPAAIALGCDRADAVEFATVLSKG